MYKSMLTGREILDAAKGCADISPEISDEMYILWLNTLQGQIYSSVVASLAVCELKSSLADDGRRYFSLNMLDDAGRAPVRACDIETVLCCGEAFAKSDAASAAVFKDRCQFYDEGDRIYLYHPAGAGGKCRVIFREMPTLFTGENLSEQSLSVPDEHLQMPLSYLIGRAYEYANEDAQAAKWLGNYNTCLESFEKWHSERNGSMKGVCK